MRAIVVDGSARLGFDFAEIAGPEPAAGEVLISVAHVALNRGDLNDARSGRLRAGAVLGSDVAGIVIQEDPDGADPPRGSRVVALTSAAFAEQCTVDVRTLAVVPPAVDLSDAAALPVAGIAALQALRAAGARAGMRVLVTGASGGVGRFAIQLASTAGARVVAIAGSVSKRDELRELGAAEVVSAVADVSEPVDIVVESVGGDTLVAAWERLAPGGSLQSVGWASGEPAIFPPYATVGPPKSLSSFLIGGEIGADLSALVAMLDTQRLAVDPGWRGPWTEIFTAADAMLDRSLGSKVVLDVNSIPPD